MLIISAWQEETKYLEPSSDYEVLHCGIGFLDAALNLEKYLAKNTKPEKILFMATAGAYAKNLAIEQIVSVQEVALLNFGTIEDKSYLVEEQESIVASEANEDLVTVKALSSLEITKSEQSSQKIIKAHSSDLLVENMELYGIAKVAQAHGIPWSAILGITNYTDERGHEAWKANHQKLSHDLAMQIC